MANHTRRSRRAAAREERPHRPTTRRPRYVIGVVALLLIGIAVAGVGYSFVDGAPPEVILPDPQVDVSPRLKASMNELVRRARESPNSAEAHGDLGLLYQQGELYEAAARCFENAEALDREPLRWAYRRAQALESAGRTEEASVLICRLAEKDNAFAAVFDALGIDRLERGDIDGAEAAFRKAMHLAPNVPEPLVRLANICNRRADHAEARALAQRALAMDPNYRAADYQLGLAYRGLGDRDAAASELRKGMDARPRRVADPLTARAEQFDVSRQSRNAQAQALAQRGDYRQAISMLEELVREFPDDVTMLNNYASVLIEGGHYEQGLEILDRVIRIEPSHFASYLNQSFCYLQTKDPANAVSAARQAVGCAPQQSACHVALGDALLRSNQLADAIGAYREARRLDPTNVLLLNVMGQVCLRLNDPAAAIECFEAVVALDEATGDVFAHLCTAALDAGDVNKAASAYARLESIAPHHAKVATLRSRLSSING